MPAVEVNYTFYPLEPKTEYSLFVGVLSESPFQRQIKYNNVLQFDFETLV